MGVTFTDKIAIDSGQEWGESAVFCSKSGGTRALQQQDDAAECRKEQTKSSAQVAGRS
jgi:hypothetical protein